MSANITPYQAITAYALGRFLALAEMAGDPLYRLSNDELVERMKSVAAEYEAGSSHFYRGTVIEDLNAAVDQAEQGEVMRSHARAELGPIVVGGILIGLVVIAILNWMTPFRDLWQ